jgi:PhnB protein
MTIHPYLNFKGQCREAMEHYARVFGATVVSMQTHGESPIAEHVPPENHDLILHACIERDGFILMASDAPPDSYEPPRGLWVSVQVQTAAEADRLFGAFARGGSVVMPIGETFWAARFGMVIDRYGIPWMINCDNPQQGA